MATSRITDDGWGAKLANMARAWLGGQTPADDDAPVTYELETEARTADNQLVVLRAGYTVGPKIAAGAGAGASSSGDKLHEPLLLRTTTKPAAPVHGRAELVKKLVGGHVVALAAGLTAEEISIKISRSCFVKQVVERVQPVLADLGLHVYGAQVERLDVRAPASTADHVPVPAANARRLAAANRALEEALAYAKSVEAELHELMDRVRNDSKRSEDEKEAVIKRITEGLKDLAVVIGKTATTPELATC